MSVKACQEFVTDAQCGGINLFVGTTRQENKGQEITHLDFECYESMATAVMSDIAEESKEKFGIKKIALHHRTGIVKVKEIAVIIAVSSKHRKASFEACSYAIDQLKKRVPIWKKEYTSSGAYWVNSRP